MSLPREKLDRLVDRWQLIQSELNAGVAQATYAKLTKEFADLSPVVTAINDYYAADRETRELEQMAADPAADRDMAALARDELQALKPRLAALEHQLKIELLPKDKNTLSQFLKKASAS
jgi:peptide chain release factor 1